MAGSPIEVDVPTSANATGEADSLRRVVDNLIDNAMKYGAPPVRVTLDALPGVELNGAIHSIGQTYSENQGDIVYEVTLLLNDAHPAMRWGMTAAVRFESED